MVFVPAGTQGRDSLSSVNGAEKQQTEGKGDTHLIRWGKGVKRPPGGWSGSKPAHAEVKPAPEASPDLGKRGGEGPASAEPSLTNAGERCRTEKWT